jgi:hypothetical protein
VSFRGPSAGLASRSARRLVGRASAPGDVSGRDGPRRTEALKNPVGETSCGFESHLRHDEPVTRTSSCVQNTPFRGEDCFDRRCPDLVFSDSNHLRQIHAARSASRYNLAQRLRKGQSVGDRLDRQCLRRQPKGARVTRRAIAEVIALRAVGARRTSAQGLRFPALARTRSRPGSGCSIVRSCWTRS